MNKPDLDQQELLLAFVEEGLELLDEVEPLLIELESKSNESGEVDIESLNTIFRLFHSLKGGAGFLNLNNVGKVTHEAETLLDIFRKGKGKIISDHIDLLNRTCDFIRKLLVNIESKFTDSGFEDEAEEIKRDLSKLIVTITHDALENQSREGITRKESIENDLHANDTSSDEDIQQSSSDESQNQPESVGNKNSLQLVITPEMIKQFTAESEDLLAAAEEALLNLEKDPANEEFIGQAFRSLHSFKGNAGFLGYSDLEQLSHEAETVLDKIRCGEISSNSQMLSLLLDFLDFLREGVTKINNGKAPTIASISGLISLIQDSVIKIAKNNKKKNATQKATEIQDKRSKTTEKIKQKDTQSTVPRSDKEPVKSSAKKKIGGTKSTQNATVPTISRSQRQSVRVDVEKLDVLLNLVGELVIAEAMVSQNPDIKELDISLDRFEKSSMHLNKITRDLQDVSTSIRMIPLVGTFRRMIRLVRDLAHKTDKKIELIINGEETEVDKTVIEKITDPLVHIIRNSIDHGIGSPEIRKKQNKSKTGHINLDAKYVGGEVWISIKDDGMGLNRQRILKKAIDRGLVDDSNADMSDEDVWKLVFTPGFSTAEQVTDVSGRGVGMDVVRRNIENIRGKVEIRSEPGKGTEVILKIPLTLAIIDGMIIRVGQNLYTIPIVAINETFRLNEKQITTTMDGKEIIHVRGNLLPVIRLHDFFNINTDCQELQDGIIMIVENAEKMFGIFVDEIIGQQQIVIKGLSEYIGAMRGFSGCTILGDGNVSLIIDIAGLSKLTETTDKLIDEYSKMES